MANNNKRNIKTLKVNKFMGNITQDFNDFELAGNGEVWSEIPQEHKNSLIVVAKTILQPARDILKEAIHISSGYRSAKHNAIVHGATSSQHLCGKATDIYVSSLTGLQLFEFMIKNFSAEIGGIGLYSDSSLKSKFIHIDIRNKPNKTAITSWYCDSNGVYVPVTPLMHSIAKKYGITLLG